MENRHWTMTHLHCTNEKNIEQWKTNIGQKITDI